MADECAECPCCGGDLELESECDRCGVVVCFNCHVDAPNGADEMWCHDCVVKFRRFHLGCPPPSATLEPPSS